MRKLSLWAKLNPHFARIIIVVSHILLIWIAGKFAMQFTAAGVQLSVWWTYFFIILFIIVGLSYPSKGKYKNQEWKYIKQKSCDLIAGICGFCLVFCFINQLNNGSFNQPAGAYVGVHHPAYKNPAAEKLLQDFKNGEKEFFTRKEKRIIKEEFSYQVKEYVKDKLTGKKDEAGDALLIILSCIAAIGLLLLVASLACSLSCSGSDAAAAIVGILGVVGVIWGLVAVIKGINRKHRKPSGNSPDSKQQTHAG